MSNININSFYCEDFRIEMSGQPMFLGIFPPSMEIENLPIICNNLKYANLIFAPYEVNRFDANLLIEVSLKGEPYNENFPKKMSKTFDRPDDTREGDSWMVIGHYDFDEVKFQDNLIFKTTIEIEDSSMETSLIIRQANSE